jgi:integrase
MPYFNEKRGRWCASKEIDGKRKQKWFRTKGEAKAWEAQQNAESWTKAETLAVTVLEVCNRYLDDVQDRMHVRTYKDKVTCCKRFLKVLPHGASVDDLNPDIAQAFFAKQRKSRGPSPANRDRKNLAALWTWAKELKIVSGENPFLACKEYPVDEKVRYVPPVEDMERILATETGAVRLWLLAMLHTAGRRGELFRMKWSDVDFDAGMIRLWTRKRKTGVLVGKWIRMTRALAAELKPYEARARSEFVFCQEDGQPFTSRQALMRRVCKRAKVRYFSFHAIRHLSACMLDKAMLPLTDIQKVLRHTRATTTDHYLRSLMDKPGAVTDHAFEMSPGGKVWEMKKASGE